MKKIILLGALIFSVQNATAQVKLADVMKSVGEQFKVIAVGLQTKNITEVEMASIEQLQRDVAAAALIFPDTATDDKLKLKYSTYMAELVQATLKLEDTVELEAQESPMVLTESLKVFTEINEIRKKGHAEFKAD